MHKNDICFYTLPLTLIQIIAVKAYDGKPNTGAHRMQLLLYLEPKMKIKSIEGNLGPE